MVNQFAAIAHKTNFHYCFAILDVNRRVSTTRESFPLPLPSFRSALAEPSTTTPTRPRLASILSAPTLSTPVPRQLLVAEEMDSFFPFDPLKLPLSSVYIDGIYRDWVADDDNSSSASSPTASSDSEVELEDGEETTSSEADTDEADYSFTGRSGGLAVPGAGRDKEDDDVARSFEAMSLSPEHGSFGGRSLKRMPGIVI